MNIILSTDGSEHAQAATELLRNLRLPPQTSVMIIAVADSPHTHRHYTLHQTLKQACDQLSSTDFKLSSELLYGHPAQEIIRFADEHQPELILMGAKGLRATMGILLGGVVQQVVEHARWPILVTRSPYQSLNRILLALDGSPCSQKALDYILRFPFPENAKIQILHVLPPPASEQEILAATWAAGVDAISIRPTIREELERAQIEDEQRCEELLSQASLQCKQHFQNVTTIVRRGDAASEILTHTKEHQIELIIAGSRGLSAIGGWLLGSVSRKLVHYATCSVLIVKGETCQAD